MEHVVIHRPESDGSETTTWCGLTFSDLMASGEPFGVNTLGNGFEDGIDCKACIAAIDSALRAHLTPPTDPTDE